MSNIFSSQNKVNDYLQYLVRNYLPLDQIKSEYFICKMVLCTVEMACLRKRSKHSIFSPEKVYSIVTENLLFKFEFVISR